MSNIFFLYAKNGIILIGDNMVKQGNISDRDLPVVLEIIREVFSHIPQNTTISKEAKLGKIVTQTTYVYHGNYQINQYLHFNKYNQMISEFYDILDSNFGHCNLSIFYQNFKNLQIRDIRRNILDYLNIAV